MVRGERWEVDVRAVPGQAVFQGISVVRGVLRCLGVHKPRQ